MKAKAVLAFLLLSLLAPGFPAQSEASSDWVEVLTDPATDTSLQVLGSNEVPFVSTVRWTDLASLLILEELEGFTIRVQYHPEATLPESGSPSSLDVYFRHGDQTFWLDLYSYEHSTTGAALAAVTDDYGYEQLVSPLTRVVNEEDRYYEAFVPREFLLDRSGAPPFPGRALEDFLVRSYTIQFYGGEEGLTINDWDEMPDSGQPEGVFGVRLGSVATDGLRLYSPFPSKASNGAEGTFVYEVVAENLGEDPVDLLLDVVSKPERWSMEFPISAFSLAPGASRSLPVLVSTPFAHQHGARESAELAITGIDADRSAATTISIVYYPIPQPAGHHDTIYLFASGGPTTVLEQPMPSAADLYMHTKPDDPDADDSIAFCQTPSLTGTSCGWEYVLRPDLRIGLDFSTGELGELSFVLGSVLPRPDATISGSLATVGNQEVLLARIPEVDVSSPQSGGEAAITLPIEPTEEADLVKINGSTSLVLELRMEVGHPMDYTSIETPYILPGGVMRLPLNEYREDLPQVSTEESKLEILGSSQRRANPGDHVLFEIESASTEALSVFGTKEDWSSLVRTSPTSWALVVRVPEEARAGDLADLVIRQLSLGEVALARAVLLVDDTQEYPDDKDAIAALPMLESKDSSLPFVLLPVALLIAFAIRRRSGV